MPDEDLTEDRGVCGKQDALPGGGGGQERADVRGPSRGGDHDVARVRPWERSGGRGTPAWRSTMRRHVAQWRKSQTKAMLWRSVRAWVQGGLGTCGGRGGGRGGDVGEGPAEE